MTDDRTFSLGPDDAHTLPTGPEGAPRRARTSAP